MIQLNLLPDVKLEYLKAQRQRGLVIAVSLIVSIATLGLLGTMFTIGQLQKKHLNDLSTDITSASSKLQAQPQIDRVLTVQNQLNSLTPLHNGKPAANLLFTYLNQVTPANISISNFSVDFTAQTAKITGTAPSLSDVNQYIDTLKFTTYKTDTVTTETPAFPSVVLNAFTLVSTTDPTQAAQGAQGATYTIDITYDKAIFDITQKVKLNVPKKVTTRSEIAQPTDLFKAAPEAATEGTN